METDLVDVDSAEKRSTMLAELSNRHVRLYKDLFGRGPTKVRTNFLGRDALVCTLEDSMTPAERQLVEMGEAQRMRDVRMFFQHATHNDFVGTVEELTGRKVRAFVSGIDVHEDVSSEVYYFEPVARD